MADDKLTRKSQEAVSVATRQAASDGNPQVAPVHLPQARGATTSAPETSRQLLGVINTAASLARELGDEYISTEHLLVGLATGGGPVATALQRSGADPEALTNAFTKVRGSARVTSED